MLLILEMDLTYNMMSDRFSASKASATIDHLTSNSIQRLGSVSVSDTILLYRSMMPESVEFR